MLDTQRTMFISAPIAHALCHETTKAKRHDVQDGMLYTTEFSLIECLPIGNAIPGHHRKQFPTWLSSNQILKNYKDTVCPSAHETMIRQL